MATGCVERALLRIQFPTRVPCVVLRVLFKHLHLLRFRHLRRLHLRPPAGPAQVVLCPTPTALNFVQPAKTHAQEIQLIGTDLFKMTMC